MQMKVFLAGLVTALFMLASCQTGPNPSTFNLSKSAIKKVALLPLYVDPNVRNISLGNKEVKGFYDAWNLEFALKFKKRIRFINDIQILYPHADFDVTPDMEIAPNYSKIMDNLGVDAVMGFGLVTYNEVSQGEKVGQMAGACITESLFGTSFQEKMVATFNYHNYYLHREDWMPVLYIELGGIITNQVQRQQYLDKLIEWVDTHHPLSLNYRR